MNLVTDFLSTQRARFDLGPVCGEQPACVLVTPRFRASKHVIFLIMDPRKPEPVLVAKVSRLPGEGQTLLREASNLQAAQRAHGGGLDSIPRLIAYENFRGHELLVETAVTGPAMDPATVRRRCGECVNDGLRWLTDFQLPTIAKSSADSAWFERLIEGPIDRLQAALATHPGDQLQIRLTRRIVERLNTAAVPLVFEHGDLSHPNLIIRKPGELGVVDWELADERGLPLSDAIFFLTYIAFARAKATTGNEYVAAFDRAFFGPTAWAMPYVATYARRLEIEAADLPALFAACWARQASRVISRLDLPCDEQPLDERTLGWFHGNRYYLLWQHAVENLENFTCQDWR